MRLEAYRDGMPLILQRNLRLSVVRVSPDTETGVPSVSFLITGGGQNADPSLVNFLGFEVESAYSEDMNRLHDPKGDLERYLKRLGIPLSVEERLLVNASEEIRSPTRIADRLTNIYGASLDNRGVGSLVAVSEISGQHDLNWVSMNQLLDFAAGGMNPLLLKASQMQILHSLNKQWGLGVYIPPHQQGLIRTRVIRFGGK